MDQARQENAYLTNETVLKKRDGYVPVLLMLIFYIAKTMSDTVIVNLLEKSTCLVILNYNNDNCTEPVSPTTEGELQQSAADLIMARSIIEAFFPALLTLFIGPWSDTNGRRPLLLLSITGSTVAAFMWLGLSLIPALPPVYFLLTSIPVALGGGYISFFLGLYCYVSDITRFDQRALRMGLVEGACMAGVLFSSLVSPYILKTSTQYGYSIVFAASSFLLLLLFLYTYFFVHESVNVVESERTKLWKCDHVKEIFSTCFRSRTNHIRTIVMCIIINLMIVIFLMDGELKVLYMFTQKEFGWDLVDYTRFTSFFITIAGLSLVISTWFFMSVLKLGDLPVMFLGTLSLFSKAFIQAVATSGFYFYVSSCFCVLSVIISPLSRSQLSKLIPADDLGKVFAFTAFLEATAPVSSSPLYTFIYKETMDTLPNAVFWLSTAFSGISVLLIGSALILHRLSSPPDLRLILDDDECGTTTVQA